MALLLPGIFNFSLDFDDFVTHSLKTAGSHSISGKWELSEAFISRNLKNIKINNLNLANDVVRMPLQNDSTNPPLTVEALKTVQGGTISRLHATPESQVAEVPVAKWIHGAAYLYGNHSIAGITRLNNINLYNDLTVNGPVNGVPWQTDKLILIDKDQDVPGSLLVSNSLPEQKRVMSNNVKNLWVDFVNDLPVNELLVSKAENRPNLHVESQLIFTQPLTVGYYEAGNGNGLLDKYYKKKRGVESNDIHDWQQLQENVAAIKNRLAKPPKVLESFAVLQQLPHKASHMKIISVDNKDVLAIWEQMSSEVGATYTWQPDIHLFGRSSSAALTQLNKTNLNPINEETQNPQKLQFRSYGFQCRALQEENQLVIRCLDEQNNSREAILPRRDVKQLLPVADSDEMTILLRTPRAVELWKWSNGNYSLSSRLMDGQVEQMALSQGGAGMESEYVALMASSPAAEIRIYSFGSPDTSSFQLDQVLELQDLQQLRVMRFMHLPESDDLLLCVSNVLPQQQLRIYQHSGAAGFQQILGDSALPKAHALEVLQLPSHHMLQLLSIATEEAVYLLQPQFTTL